MAARLDLIPPAVLGVMMAPVTAIGAQTSSSSTSVFLAAVSLLMLGYYLLVGFRAGRSGTFYLTASLSLALYLLLTEGGDRGYQVFLLSLGFMLYAIDRIERVWREFRAGERIPTS